MNRSISKSQFAILILILSSLYAADSTNEIAKRWWAHVQVLAADDMEGRDTGSEGYRRAARYVVEQFERDGLKPAGVNTYYQPVPLRSWRADKSTVQWVHDGKTDDLRMNWEVSIVPRSLQSSKIDAGMVFAGYGATESDFGGLDAKGKLVLVLSGARGSAAQRTRLLINLGAAGIVTLDNPRAIEPPKWPVAYSRTVAIDAGDRPPIGPQLLALRLSAAEAIKILPTGGHSFEEILDLASAGKPLPHFALPGSLRLDVHIEEEKLTSDNIIAALPGSDPELANEYVVVSAHLDAYGFGEPVNGDRLYNGAMDDAASVAHLLELAADLKRSGKKLRRGLLFLVVTGEEKGLLGSNFFVAHPTLAKERLVADINLDYLRPIFPLKILTTLGLEESTLGDSVRKVAAPLNIRIQNDDEPERGLFTRSDQYNFIRSGIPGVAFIFGYDKGSPEEKTYRKWYAERYHRPSDDLNQPVDMAAAAKFQQFFSNLVEEVANANKRPKWNPSSRYAPGATVQ